MDRRRAHSPCEADNIEGRVDGRIGGRIGVQVESEMVLKCKRKKNEVARDMLY